MRLNNKQVETASGDRSVTARFSDERIRACGKNAHTELCAPRGPRKLGNSGTKKGAYSKLDDETPPPHDETPPAF